MDNHGWLVFWLVLLIVGFAVKMAVDNVKRGIGRVADTVRHNPIAGEVGKHVVSHFLRRILR